MIIKHLEMPPNTGIDIAMMTGKSRKFNDFDRFIQIKAAATSPSPLQISRSEQNYEPGELIWKTGDHISLFIEVQ